MPCDKVLVPTNSADHTMHIMIGTIIALTGKKSFTLHILLLYFILGIAIVVIFYKDGFRGAQ